MSSTRNPEIYVIALYSTNDELLSPGRKNWWLPHWNVHWPHLITIFFMFLSSQWVEKHFWHLSWVKARGQLAVHLQLTVVGKNVPPLHTNPKVCGWQSRAELPLLSDCTTEPKCSPVRKSRHFQIYRWINWQCWECLTGHSSWRSLAQ